MNTKLLIATVLGFIAYFFSGWGVYDGFISGQMTYAEGLKEAILLPESDFKMSYMALSCLVWAFLIAYLFQQMNVTDWKSGAIKGATIGVLASLSFGFGMAAQFKFGSINNTLWDVVGSAITSAIVGAVTAWWLGRK